MIDAEEKVILVDAEDRELGTAPKLWAHREGLLHRAFSVYIFNSKSAPKLMLQKRAKTKYHSGGLWTNTCCGHPRPGEDVAVAARRRLLEEMGFDARLSELTNITYRAELGEMREHEFLHIFTGTFDGEPKVDPSEAEDYKWVGLEELRSEVRGRPREFTEWLKISLPHIKV
jgi:isopentenyl-diphosphate Delta-isomerase